MILITNDDGINAPGLRKLHEAVSEIDHTIVVAPETEQSAVGHAITLSQPLKIREVKENGKLFGYAVNGTPADCVKIALTTILSDSPILTVSGINHGSNLGSCVIYSGTVSAATEAAVMGIPAIAISLSTWEEADFTAAGSFAKRFIPQILSKGLPSGIALNINVPAIPEQEIRGVVWTRQSKTRVIETFDKRIDPRNNSYFWMAGEIEWDDSEDGTDSTAVNNGYVSITPIHHDLTHYKALNDLRNWKIEFG
tara:strand:+ start:2619 stop:3377 length:759 start_codon:yes stop_codon:yes gene_type:complete